MHARIFQNQLQTSPRTNIHLDQLFDYRARNEVARLIKVYCKTFVVKSL